MKKIRKITIKNFQSHKDTEIHLDDYVIIHGATNSGKSAIIRAIKWCLYNESPPEGAELTRFGEKDTEVAIYFNDGTVIVRKRAGKLNEYILYDAAGVATNYTGFGRGPLKEVLDFHGMYQTNLFGEPQSVNIVDQQEPPFFLSEGPTARGHLISRLAETLTYEAALIMLKKDAGELRRGLDAKRTSIDNLSSEIEKLEYLDTLESFLNDARKASEAIEINERFISSSPTLETCIRHDIVAYRENFETASLLDEIVKAQEAVQTVESQNSSVKAVARARELLEVAINNWRRHYDTYDKLRGIEDATNKITEADNNISAVTRIGTILEKYKNLVDSYISFKNRALLENEISGVDTELGILEGNLSLISQIKNVGQKIKQLSGEYIKFYNQELDFSKTAEQKAEEYKSLLLESGTCPTCFSKISEESLIGVDV